MSVYLPPHVKPSLNRLLTPNYDDIAAQSWGWEVE
jgi:hypothetical protein